MTGRHIFECAEVDCNGSTAENVVGYDQEFPQRIVPRITPNTTSPIGVRQHSGKHRTITIDFDSVTDIFDAYIDDDGVNPVIPSLVITFTITGGDTQVHTFEANHCYVKNRGRLVVEKSQLNKVWRIVIVCIGTRIVTHP